VVELDLGPDRSQAQAPLGGGLPILVALEDMAEDPRVRGVVLDLRNLSGGHASLQDLRLAVERLRRSGKLVVTHLHSATARELLVASAADRIWLSPSGEVALQPVAAGLTFYGDALAHLGVKVDMVAAGAYKSFGEPYTRAYSSAANREQMGALVGDLQEQVEGAIAAGRRIVPARLRELFGRALVSAEEALAAGLVDELLYPDQARARLGELLDAEVRPLPIHRYAMLLRAERWLAQLGQRRPRLAVVHLEGPIVMGAEVTGGAGARIDADRVVPLLDELTEQGGVGAVVLHVDSPGGSALASDLIARAVERLGRKVPVVAAFGDVSASGGYYLSAPAREIVARPGTITGSIGVVGGKLVLGGVASRMGVHHETISSQGSDAPFFSPWSTMSPAQRAEFQRTLARTYQRFLAVVSAGRHRPVEAIEPHAQGRVWTGRQALERGLVDHLGNLDLAMERARKLASLRPEAEVLHYHFPPPRFRVLSALMGAAQARSPDLLEAGIAALGPAGPLLRWLRHHPGQALALWPWSLEGDPHP
jgi:protease-4